MDQSFFAAPHGLSQRSTSFIASQRQGIHRTPLRHLIALIINVHTLGRMLATVPLAKRALDERISRNRTLMRKTRLLRKIEPTAMRSSVAERTVLQLDHLAMKERRKRSGDNEVNGARKSLAASPCDPQLGSISSLRCQKSRMHAHQNSTCKVMFRGRF